MQYSRFCCRNPVGKVSYFPAGLTGDSFVILDPTSLTSPSATFLKTDLISAFDWTFCDAECGQFLLKDREDETTSHLFTYFVFVIWIHLVWFFNLSLKFIVDLKWSRFCHVEPGASTMMSVHAILGTYMSCTSLHLMTRNWFLLTEFPFLFQFLWKLYLGFLFLFGSIVPNCFGAGCPQMIRKPCTRKPSVHGVHSFVS